MNFIDRAISAVSPGMALKREEQRMRLDMMRQIKNSGYDESGASRIKKSMQGWNANSKSPQEDIDKNLNLLRQRSRSLWMTSPIAVSAIKTTRTNVVGSGLRLKSRIDFDFLGLTREAANAWEINTEREFGLWADSKQCDAVRLNDFYELQQLALISWLMNGDGIALIKNQSPVTWMPYGLRIHLIEADRVSTPNSTGGIVDLNAKAKNGNRIYNGIEIDKYGGIVAYHICNTYPNSQGKKQWIRVEAIGEKTGNPNILHIMESERPEQYRGVPYLAPVIESLKQLTRYTEAELMAAVINGFFTVFIKTDGNTGEIPYGAVVPEEQQIETSDPNDYELGPGAINVLGVNESIEIADSKRPNVNFDGFVSALAKYIGAALEVPHELLTKSFTASYSASRAALLEAWKAFRMRRSWFANDFCQPIYELWLSEAVARGRIKAPGFFNDPAIKKAWCKAEWNGPSAGQIDPVREVNAAILRVQEGFSTKERETMELTGGDWDKNIDQIQRENELMNKIRSKEGNHE